MSTRIEVGDRILWSDGSQWILGRRAIRKAKDGGTEEYDHGLKFFPTIDSVLKALLDDRLRKSGATSFQELRAELDRFRSDIAELMSV